jgi:hypothetical protein
MHGTVALLGNLSFEPSPLEIHVKEFGWSLENAARFERLRTTSLERHLVAVLFDPAALGMASDMALRLVRNVAPMALPILCYKFSEKISWPELAQAGCFHSLGLPLDPGEVRQSLGFVHAAENPRSAKLSFLFRLPPKLASEPSIGFRYDTPALVKHAAAG